mgnify:CR=1 FL=1
MPVARPQGVFPILIPAEQTCDSGMLNRLVAIIDYQVLLAHIGNIAALAILGEQVIERLILGGSNTLRNSFIPFVAIGKYGVDIEHHTPKSEQLMLQYIADAKTRMGDWRSRDMMGVARGKLTRCPIHAANVGIVVLHTRKMRQFGLAKASVSVKCRGSTRYC